MSSNRTPLLPFIGVLLVTVGCPSASVSLRADGSPGPEKCSEEALKTMRILRMHVGDATDVELDANQIDVRPITLYDGPVESYLDGSLGTLESGTRLYGRVWTSGPLVVVRYYEAKPLDGDTVPICAVARLGDQFRKRPESKPGTAILDYSNAAVFVVDSFR
ncbi:MAG: serine/threonine protein kinase [Archangium sp.]